MEYLKYSNCLKELVVEGGIVLKWILKKKVEGNKKEELIFEYRVVVGHVNKE